MAAKKRGQYRAAKPASHQKKGAVAQQRSLNDLELDELRQWAAGLAHAKEALYVPAFAVHVDQDLRAAVDIARDALVAIEAISIGWRLTDNHRGRLREAASALRGDEQWAAWNLERALDVAKDPEADKDYATRAVLAAAAWFAGSPGKAATEERLAASRAAIDGWTKGRGGQADRGRKWVGVAALLKLLGAPVQSVESVAKRLERKAKEA